MSSETPERMADSLAEVRAFIERARERQADNGSEGELHFGHGASILHASTMMDVVERCERAERELAALTDPGTPAGPDYALPETPEPPRAGDDWQRRAQLAEGRVTRARMLAEQWAAYAPETYGRGDEQRVKFAKSALDDASNQLIAVLDEDPWTGTPPRVPDLPCPQCGDSDVVIEYCAGDWLAVLPENRDRGHFHRLCKRCSYRWRTNDALGAEEPEVGVGGV